MNNYELSSNYPAKRQISENIAERKNNPPLDPLEIIKGHLGSLLDAIHKFGITVTGAAPFSSRGLFFKLAISPILIPIRLMQSAASPDFSKAMKMHMDYDWNQGIQDFYTDLEGNDDKTKKLRQEVIGANLRYAGFMKRQREGVSIVSSTRTFPPHISETTLIKLKEIQDNLKAMGFAGRNDHYYHLDSGIIFNIVYDDTCKEIILCFSGLKTEGLVDDDNDEVKNKNKLFARRIAGIAAEHLGGIPLSASQAMEIGKMIKDATQGSGITPVMVGHSHGGSIAQCAAIANGLKGIVFNSRPIGAGTRRYIGQSTVAKNASKITAFSERDDWLSGNKALNILAVFFERVTGIPVPRTVGIGYHLPETGYGKGHSSYFEVMKKMDLADKASV